MSAVAHPATPCLVLDLDAFARNVDRMAGTIVRDGGKRWRPHVKAIRSPALARRLIDAGAVGVTCSNVRHAATMVAAGIDDVLVTTQVVCDADVAALVALNRNARVPSAVDSPWQARRLSDAAGAAGVSLPVLIEVDIGLARAGVPPGAPAVALARALQDLPGLSFQGLMAWEGHTTKIRPTEAKEAAIRASVGLLTDTARQCREAGLAVAVVSCGGTGTYPVTSRIDGVTELQAGGGVFGDRRYQVEFDIGLETALTLRTTVISRPTPRRVVCDAGWKSTGLHPRPSEPIGLPPIARTSFSAEHLAIELAADDATLLPGSIVTLAVGYADATVFLHRRILTMQGDRIGDEIALPADV
jgi:D-serine deaminase-like pyridoxal phosphate-dependent protein